MNQTFHEKQTVQQALQHRASLAPAQMYQLIGREEPVQAPRFNVVPLGENSFDVIERSTGYSRGVRSGHDSACHYAQELEQNAKFIDSIGASARCVGRHLLRWTIGISVLLVAFAYYGAGH